MIPSAGSDLGTISAAGGYGPPGGGGYGPPPGGGGGYGPPPGGFGGPPPGAPPGYGGPPPGYGGYGGGPPGGFGAFGDRSMAESKIKAPALTMMICTIIGALFQILNLIMQVVGAGAGLAQDDGNEIAHLMSGAVGVVAGVIALLCSGVCVWGFLRMMKLEARTLSYVAVIMSMVPCTGVCCYVNMFVGIWALMVLADPVVKEHHH